MSYTNNHYSSVLSQFKRWCDFLEGSLKNLLEMQPVPYTRITPSVLPKRAGVYLLSEVVDDVEITLYVGRSKNLRDRIYRNHLMGDITNARLKKYMMQDKSHSAFGDKLKAKTYIKSNCIVRWILEDDIEKEVRLKDTLPQNSFRSMEFQKNIKSK